MLLLQDLYSALLRLLIESIHSPFFGPFFLLLQTLYFEFYSRYCLCNAE
jgi:hypothetical protein